MSIIELQYDYMGHYNMKHIYAASSLVVKENLENAPSEQELQLPDGKSIAELIDENQKNQETQREDDSQQGNGNTLS